MHSLLWTGVGLPLLATALILATSGIARGTWRYLAYAVWLAILAAMSLRQSGGGLRHDGALFVLVVALVPVAISALLTSSWSPRLGRLTATAAAWLFGVTAVGAGAYAAWEYRQQAVHSEVVQWLETHVPAGTVVYLADAFIVPLPTDRSAESLWTEATHPDAWRAKFARAAQRLDLGRDGPPRAMSEDPMQLERALRRQ
jgi:hypothetical protein